MRRLVALVTVENATAGLSKHFVSLLLKNVMYLQILTIFVLIEGKGL